ncbi:assimilatory nitrate reductase catalytic subunit NasC [Salipaludibacillus aurantiacus]|uniref:Assimilatory nitrate reductase catalytic subunit n=1 Tax=Salipaludibacillus aurantiacus TaxID=1601833 RepID=A0A1H9WYI9_9BACI|nr:molybdopterin oxidoreductase family protein [Salipaludibacillus aurantiacus]SES38925.1 assimilatory nitrate reductase catalytic subunit [Salipaludibacillus aurantiacus]
MDEFLKHFRTKQLKEGTEKVMPSQCPYCSVQCTMDLIEDTVFTNKRFKAKPDKGNPTSGGRMCIKGANAHQHVYNDERITHPLLKIDGEFVPVPWELACEYIAKQFQSIQHFYGKDSIGVYGGGSLTNEVTYLLGKFARVALKTKHIDYNGRFCMSAAAAASNAAFGIDRGLSNSLQEIPDADCIILAGTNIADCQPTIVPYFRQAKKNGAFIIVSDPRETATTKLADLHLKPKPGTDAMLAHGLLKILIDEGFTDSEFIASRTNGYTQLAEDLTSISLQRVSDVTEVSIEDLKTAARKYGDAPNGFVLTARGVEQHANGSYAVGQFINLVLATGKIGRYGNGFGSITGQGNGQGGREHGQKADQLPGYRSIEEYKDRKIISDLWGIDECDLPGKGVSAYEMIEKMAQGEIKGLFVMGSNPAVSNPNGVYTEHALRQLDYLVVADMFLSETARMADLVLPVSSYLENEGTMTNMEGRVTLRKAAKPVPKTIKHDWEILCDLAKYLGAGNAFSFSSAQAIFEELRVASKGAKADYYGISYDRLSHETVCWPCPDEQHPGTQRLFDSEFAHADGRAVFSPLELEKALSEAMTNEEYPLLLTTGRLMSHYLTGVQTRRSPDLLKRDKEPLLHIHPDTAACYRIEDNELVELKSSKGTVIIRASFTTAIRKDTLFAPFHWGDSQSVNRVTQPRLDPVCKMPEFKRTAVAVVPLVEKSSTVQTPGETTYEAVD